MKKILRASYSFLLVAGVAVVPHVAAAQSLFLKVPKTAYETGDSFQASLVIETGGQSINTVSGLIDIPQDKFQILDVRYGSSVITLWVDKPKIDYGRGVITFAGGIPGGFNGSAGPLLNFGLKARRVGAGTFTLQDIKVLLNDGQGTEMKGVVVKPLVLSVRTPAPMPLSPPAPQAFPPAEQQQEASLPPPDIVPPESFIPMVSRHPSVADDKYFASFSAVDKDTGIAYYEIKEKPSLLGRFTDKFDTPWVRGESPYILRGQWWGYEVFVRAYDQAGNSTVASAQKPFHPAVISLFGAAAVIASALAGYGTARRRSRGSKKILRR